jgi:hypothetical protein
MTRVRAWVAAIATLLGLLGPAAGVHADDSDEWSFEMAFRLGPVVSLSRGADVELESGAGLEFGGGPRFVAPSGWGIGLDVAADFELDGDAPSYVQFVTDVYGMHRFAAGEHDFITLRLGPSLWYADAGITTACIEDCPDEIVQRRAVLDAHDSVVVAGVAGVGVSRAFGPLLVGADLRGRVGRALADDASPLRAQVLLVLYVTMRVPPDRDFEREP